MSKPKTRAATPTRGRPSSYSAAVATAICDRIASGESQRSICAEDGMPSHVTIRRWLDASEDFRTQYARAREAQAESFMEELVDIADSGDEKNVQHRKLRLDARKFAIVKILPKKYGDRAQVEHSGTVTLAELVTASYAKKKDEDK